MTRLAALGLTATLLGGCGGGGAAAHIPAGTPEVLYAGQIYSYGIPLQLDDTSVIFAVGQSTITQVMSIPKAGGAAARLLPPTDAQVGTISYHPAFALHAGTIYACRTGELDAVPATGGDVTKLAALPSDTKACLSIVATDDAVYVLRTDGGIYGVPAAGGTALRLDDADDNGAIVTDGHAVYYTGAWTGPTTTCPSFLYVGLRRVSLAAPVPVELGCLAEDDFQSPALAGGFIASASANTQVQTFALDPFGLVQSVAKQAGTFSVATDGREVVWSRWAEDGSGTIPRQTASIQAAAASGGTPRLLMSGGTYPTSLALDDSFVYFIDRVPADGGSSYAIQRIGR